MPEYLYGHWPVQEALKAKRRHLEQLLLAERIEERGAVGEIIMLANAIDLPVKRVPRGILDDLSHGANHQGTVLRVGPYPYADVEDILELSVERNEKPFLLVLDLLKDPQNVGALMRVAESVGVHGIILQERRSVGITPAAVGASAGATEHLRVAQVTNIVSAMRDLKKEDIWLAGLDADPTFTPLDKADLNMALGLVLGSEGEGMRRLVRENCDLLVTLPMRGRVGSLNVATAGSVVLYAAWQARGWPGWPPGGPRND